MGIIKSTFKAAAITMAAGIGYIGVMWAASDIPGRYSQQIGSESQLAQVIKEERQKIDPKNNCTIEGVLTDHYEANSNKIGNNQYRISLGGGGKNRSTIRHELYHILAGHLEGFNRKSDSEKFVEYLFWFEPKAIIYQTTGLKL